eukprot:PhM_4_TR4583/c0_g1_i1/m.99029/K04348/PPP3C, CNA; serine/threonine-protein phosphatase 2B catalytic subunit
MDSETQKRLSHHRPLMDVAPPYWDELPTSKVFDATGKPIIENIKVHFLKEGRLAEKDAIELVRRAGELLREEANLLVLAEPITIVGDIHGQYYDLIKLLEIGGDPLLGDQSYLFLGDYVDRGCFSCEVTLLLFAYKILSPKSFFMLRGNHECRHLTAYFNFKMEAKFKYSTAFYDALMNAFDALPLAATLNAKYLCVHGGLSPDLIHVEDINSIFRFREPPSSGVMCDLLWSDPMEEDDELNQTTDIVYAPNELRGCSYVFNHSAVCQFLSQNNLLCVIRAHEAQDEGYRLYKKHNVTGFPSILCIFSAPNYCDTYDNKGAILRFSSNNVMNLRQYNSCPHPYYLPNFMNAFTWSLPFVTDKIQDVLENLASYTDDTVVEASAASGQSRSASSFGGAAPHSRVALRQKVLALGRMSLVLQRIRQN